MAQDFSFRMDRTAFKRQTHQEAAHKLAYWRSRSLEERLAAATYLNSIVYGFDLANPPRMDKIAFSMRKQND